MAKFKVLDDGSLKDLSEAKEELIRQIRNLNIICMPMDVRKVIVDALAAALTTPKYGGDSWEKTATLVTIDTLNHVPDCGPFMHDVGIRCIPLDEDDPIRRWFERDVE